MNKLTLRLTAAGLSWLIAPATAAPREISIRALSFQQGFPDEVHAHLASGAATVGEIQVKSFLNHEKNLLTFEGDQLIFTRKSNPSSATDVNQQIGTVDLPVDLKSTILLLVPISQKPGEFQSRVIPIDDSSAAFPAGFFKIANVGSLAIKIELAGDTHQCEAGKTLVLEKVPFGENQSVSMRAYCKRGDQWKLITSGIWSNPGTKRVLQVFIEDLLTKEVTLKGIRDIANP
ncbi:hypothetical protein HQ447_11200 [bacterium]|nr:hypothetical protein [bacterium]